MNLIDRLRKTRVLPVIEIDDAKDAPPLANALADGGIGALEFTLRTGAALDAIVAAKKARPELLVGAGTVLDGDSARKAVAAGADFIVTPGATRELLVELATLKIPSIPGVATASEVLAVRAHGIKFMKFFPAEPAGGVAYLKALAGPLADVIFCPTGGIGPDQVAEYLKLKNVVCVGGSWVAPRTAITLKDWGQIEANARRATAN